MPRSVINSRRFNQSDCIGRLPARACLQDIELATGSQQRRRGDELRRLMPNMGLLPPTGAAADYTSYERRTRFDASGACRGKEHRILGADLNRSESARLLGALPAWPMSGPVIRGRPLPPRHHRYDCNTPEI